MDMYDENPEQYLLNFDGEDTSFRYCSVNYSGYDNPWSESADPGYF